MVVKTNCDPGSTGQDVLRRKTQGNIMLGAILRATAGNGPQAAVFQFAPAHVPYLSTALPRQNERLNERAERPTLARGRRPDQPQLVVRQNAVPALFLARPRNADARRGFDNRAVERPIEKLGNGGEGAVRCDGRTSVNNPVKERDHIAARDILDTTLAPFRQDVQPEPALGIVCRVRLGLGAGVAFEEGRDDRGNRINTGLSETGSLQRVLLFGCGVAPKRHHLQGFAGAGAGCAKFEDGIWAEGQLPRLARVSIAHCPGPDAARLKHEVEPGEEPIGDLHPLAQVGLEAFNALNGEGFGHGANPFRVTRGYRAGPLCSGRGCCQRCRTLGANYSEWNDFPAPIPMKMCGLVSRGEVMDVLLPF